MKFGTEVDKTRLHPDKGRNNTIAQCERINSDGREVKQRQTRNNPPPVVILPQEEPTQEVQTPSTIVTQKEEAAPDAIITQKEVEEAEEAQPQQPVL